METNSFDAIVVGIRNERRLGRQGTHRKRPEDAGARTRPHGPAPRIPDRHQGSLGSAVRQPHHAGNAPAQARPVAHRLSRRPRTNTGSSTTSTILTSRSSPSTGCAAITSAAARSCGRARAIASVRSTSRRTRRKASAFHGPSPTTKSRRGTTRRKSSPASAAASKVCTQLPDGKFLPPHDLNCVEVDFKKTARRKARPQAHHRPLRQSHRAAHAQREPAARHLPGAQPVHPRLSVSAATSAASRPRCRPPSAPAT